MSGDLLEAYIDAWLGHTVADESPEGRAKLDEYLAYLADDAEYLDVPSGNRHVGRDGVAAMCTFVSTTFSVDLSVGEGFTDGERFAFEFASTLHVKESGATVASKGVAIGSFRDGKVAVHHDYHVAQPQPAPG